MLARYAPEYPCLLGGLVNAGKREAQAFRGFTLHIVLETIPNQPRGYTAADAPVYGDQSGPTCLHLPSPPYSQANPVRHQPNFVDGVEQPDRQGHRPRRAAVRPQLHPRHRVRRQRGRVRRPQEPARPRARGVAAGRARPRACCWSGRWPVERRCRCDDTPRRARPCSALVKLLIFMVVTALATGVLAIIIGNISFGSTQTYRAEFADATGLVKGDDVRIAGVKVGSVKSISIVDRTRAMVTFDVQSNTALTQVDPCRHPLPQPRRPALRRADQRDRQHRRAAPGSTIPVAHTSPALDLTVLFNGFKPLFQALSPSDVNELSYEIIQVFQGQGGTLDGLLAHTASITQTLADRDQVIGQLITNLNSVLDHVGQRNHQLNQLITTFQQFVGGLKKDRGADPRLAQPDLHPVGADRRPGLGDPGAVRLRHPPPARLRGATSTRAGPRSTGPCRCCRSS